MANQEHLDIFWQGVEKWNRWREKHPEIQPDLGGANLSNADFSKVNLSGAYLGRTNFHRTKLVQANLSKAILKRANLTKADLTEANLTETDFGRAILTQANLSRANMTGCFIYAVSAWDVKLEKTIQLNLVITRSKQPPITVDNIEVAQFIYLLVDNPKIRGAIDAIAKKAVLILGRFTPERKAVLDALKETLRAYGYLPILFDFDKPSSQDLTETVSTLAHLSRFILVDLTDPSSAPYEVGTIASNHIRPIQALFRPSDEAKRVFAMFPDLVRRYHWVLPPYEYQDQEHLLASLQAKVIEPAEQKAQELEKR